MTTKIRLWLDFSMQTVFLALLLWWIISNPADTIRYLGQFVAIISAWQIMHSAYVVKKYRDWHRSRHLSYVKQIIWYSIFATVISLLTLVLSFGFLFPFVIVALDITLLVMMSALLFLAFNYFGISLRILYERYTQPRSFWDL